MSNNDIRYKRMRSFDSIADDFSIDSVLNKSWSLFLREYNTRGFRNNNPFNIRSSKANNWIGLSDSQSDKSFCRFLDLVYGCRAAFILIENYIHKGYDTVEKIISRFAPASENDTDSYIKFICTVTGLSKSVKLVTDMSRLELLSAIILFENGVSVIHYHLVYSVLSYYYLSIYYMNK